MKVYVYREFQDVPASFGGGDCCSVALDFYKQIFVDTEGGGEVYSKQMRLACPDASSLHLSSLLINKDFHFLVGVTNNSGGQQQNKKVAEGNEDEGIGTQKDQGQTDLSTTSLSLFLIVDSKNEADQMFADLSANGGSIEMAMSDMPSSGTCYYGVCVDPFGTRWMIYYKDPQVPLVKEEGRETTSNSNKMFPETGKSIKVGLYRNFVTGNCEQAFEFYKDIFGGEFLWKTTWANSPPDTVPIKADKDKIMHVSLPLSSDFVLMGCDAVSITNGKTCPYNMDASSEEYDGNVAAHPSEHSKKINNSCSLSLAVESREYANDLISELSANGGMIHVPMADQFWGDYFGKCTDHFGTQWMISHNQDCSSPKHKTVEVQQKCVLLDSPPRSSDTKVCIYRNFHGNCAKAFHFYQKVFGGEFISWTTWADALQKDTNQHDMRDGTSAIMHVGLLLTDEVKLIGCDDFPMSFTDDDGSGAKKRQKLSSDHGSSNANCRGTQTTSSNTIHIPIIFSAMEHAERVFNALLANGGVVQIPLSKKRLAGTYFCMCMDRFGTQWMIRFPPPPDKNKPSCSAKRCLKFQS